MSIPVVHPWDNIFFFELAFIPCKNIHHRPDSTRLNASSFVLFTFKLSRIDQMFGDIWSLIGWILWAENPDWMSKSKFVYWSRGQNQNK